MDQVTKIYNEIVTYDPSLAEHKEKIFSLIEQMVAAKPIFSFDPQRKQQLDDRIADHIAQAPAIAKPYSYGRAAKRGVSLASFWIIGVVAAASVVYLKIEQTNQKKVKHATQNAQLSSTGTTEVALVDTGSTHSVAVADQGDLVSDSIATTNQNQESTRTTAVVATSIVEKETVGGGASVNVVAALPPPDLSADTGSSLTVSKEEVAQQQRIALVFVGPTTQNISSILGIPATFVTTELQLKSALVFTSKVNVIRPLDEKIRDGQKIVSGLEKSLQQRNVIVLHASYATSIDVAKAIIEKLQAKGYVFVTVSELND